MTKKPDKPKKKSSKSTKKSTSTKTKTTTRKSKKKTSTELKIGYSQSPRYFLLSDRAKRTADALEIDIDTIQHVMLPSGMELIGQCLPMTEKVELTTSNPTEIDSHRQTKNKHSFYVLNPFQIIMDEFDGVLYLVQFNMHAQFPVIELNTETLTVKPVTVNIDSVERYLTVLEHEFELNMLEEAIDVSKPVENPKTVKSSENNIIQFQPYLDKKNSSVQ